MSAAPAPLGEFAMMRAVLCCLHGCPMCDSMRPHVMVGTADGRRLVARCESCGGERTAWPGDLAAGLELNGFAVTRFAGVA